MTDFDAEDHDQQPGHEPPPEIMQWIRNQYREYERVRKFGHVRPMIVRDLAGYRYVAVGSSKVYHDSPTRWQTFHNFLHGYCVLVLGIEWHEAERRKPRDQWHPIIQWRRQAFEFYKKHSQGLRDGQLFSVTATGPAKAHLALAYDLYVLEHHDLLSPELLRRLRDIDQFQGARYEAYVMASFVRAGFDISPEDERDRSTSHCEFVARHSSGAAFSVEAKSRHLPGILGRAGAPPPPETIVADVSTLLARALRKYSAHDRIVFIDVNVPPQTGPIFESDWFKRVARQVRQIEAQKATPVPPGFIFFTNQPYHYVPPDAPEPGRTFVFTAVHIPDFKQPDESDTDAAAGFPFIAEKYPAVRSLYDSLLTHTTIPHEFE